MEGSSENSTDVSSNRSTPIATEQQELENDQDEEESNDPLNEFRAPTIETCLQAISPDYPVISDEKGSLTSAGMKFLTLLEVQVGILFL